jgi:hypothetical protein
MWGAHPLVSMQLLARQQKTTTMMHMVSDVGRANSCVFFFLATTMYANGLQPLFE